MNGFISVTIFWILPPAMPVWFDSKHMQPEEKPSEPVETTRHHDTQARIIKRKHCRTIIFAAAMLFIGFSGVALYFFRFRTVIPKPVLTMQEKVPFPLYYPSKLPEGYVVDNQSFSNTSQVVTYYLTYDSNKKLLFSLQPKPKDFDFENFYLEKFSGEKEITTPIGRGVIGYLGSTLTASITGDRTWVLITAPEDINASEMEAVAKNLTPVQP